MARPIKETPVLTGRDAKRFEDRINNPRPITQEEIKSACEAYNSLKTIADFTF